MKIPTMNRKRVAALFAIMIIIMAGGLSTLDKDDLLRVISRLTERVSKMERVLSGVPISTVRIADAAITNAKIGNLNADKITTGVLTLQDGTDRAKMRVLDVSGNEIATVDLNGFTIKNAAQEVLAVLDADGLLINGGNIVVKNEDDETVFDTKGLVSQTNFDAGSVVGSSTQTTTSTSYVDVTGVTIAFTLDRTQKVLLWGEMTGDIQSGNNAANALGQVVVDGTPLGAPIATPGRYFSADLAHGASTGFTQQVVELSAGSHTLKLQFKTTNGSYTAQVFRDTCVVGYVILGR